MDKGEETRRLIVSELRATGFMVEAGHHEIAPGQHEIDLKEGPALNIADVIASLRMISRAVAASQGLHATFMPKARLRQGRLGDAPAHSSVQGRQERL